MAPTAIFRVLLQRWQVSLASLNFGMERGLLSPSASSLREVARYQRGIGPLVPNVNSFLPSFPQQWKQPTYTRAALRPRTMTNVLGTLARSFCAPRLRRVLELARSGRAPPPGEPLALHSAFAFLAFRLALERLDG